MTDHGSRLGGGVPVPGPASGVTVAENEPNDSSGTADLIAIGDDYTGVINTGGEGDDIEVGSDFVSFSGTAGQTIIATIVLDPLVPGTLVDSALVLRDTDGTTVLKFNDDFDGSPPPGFASQIIFTLPLTGVYFLQVLTCPGLGCDGSYTLQLRGSVGTTGGRDVIIGGSNIALPGQIALTPEVAFNLPGTTDHMVTANVVDLAGNPLENILVTFEVLSGPNIGTKTEPPVMTDDNGDALFTYTSNGEVGLDVIQASFVDDVTGNTVVNTARKYWDLDCQPNDIPDTCDLSCDAFNLACVADFPGCGRSLDECNNNAPPVAQCQDATVNTSPGLCTAPASVDDSSFDPDGDPIALSQSPTGPYNLGLTGPVTLTIDDGNLSDSCSATVTVVDNEMPSIICPDSQSVECTGPGGATASFSPTATDNCSVAGTTCSPTSGSTLSIGITGVSCSATDGLGNTNSCSSSVTVVDTTPPDITCPAPITAECTGPSGASVSFSATASDRCGPSSTICPTSGSTFSTGSTNVSCSATDDYRNSSSCGFTVTVIDTTAPTVYCIESVNPSGKNVPKAKKQNEDGFYLVSASDICTSELTMTLGGIPLYNGETVKITQRPGKSGVRLVNRMGQLNIKHFQVGSGDAEVTAMDGYGNRGYATCLVPPPPK